MIFPVIDDEAHDEPRSEPVIIGRMMWNFEKQEGVKMSDGNNQTLLQSTQSGEWIEETERQKKCAWWSVDNPHPFRTEDGRCKVCGARKR